MNFLNWTEFAVYCWLRDLLAGIILKLLINCCRQQSFIHSGCIDRGFNCISRSFFLALRGIQFTDFILHSIIKFNLRLLISGIKLWIPEIVEVDWNETEYQKTNCDWIAGKKIDGNEWSSQQSEKDGMNAECNSVDEWPNSAWRDWCCNSIALITFEFQLKFHFDFVFVSMPGLKPKSTIQLAGIKLSKLILKPGNNNNSANKFSN